MNGLFVTRKSSSRTAHPHALAKAAFSASPDHVAPTTMKENIHPKTAETTITCTCGAVYNTISTVPNLRIGICSACHPYFTGEQRFIDTAGRVDKFAQRYGSTRASRTAPKLEAAAPAPAAEVAAEA